MSKIRLALVCLFLAAGTAAADDCRHRRVIYSAPVYSAPYVAPYVAPAKEIYVPRYYPVEVQRDYYYTLGDAYRDALLADAIAFRVLQAQALGRGAQAAPNHVPRIPDQQAPPVAPQRPLMPPVGLHTEVPPKLQSIVAASCLKCHGAGNTNGLDLTDLASVSPDQRWKAYSFVNIGRMPKGGSLKDDEVQPFLDWADLGEAARKTANR